MGKGTCVSLAAVTKTGEAIAEFRRSQVRGAQLLLGVSKVAIISHQTTLDVHVRCMERSRD